MIQGFKDTMIQGYKDARIQGYKDTRDTKFGIMSVVYHLVMRNTA